MSSLDILVLQLSRLVPFLLGYLNHPPPPARWSEAERQKLLDELAEIVLARRSRPPG